MNKSRQKSWAEWNKNKPVPKFTAEQTILWLEGMREFMFEVWRNDGHSLKKWRDENTRMKTILD